MTPAELNIYARENLSRLQSDQRIRQQNIYALAALVAIMLSSKHIPRYEQIFREPAATKRETMSDEQIYEQVKALNALFGGEVSD